MSNNPYVSAIDPTIPVFGNPTTASVRENFATAKSEIEQAFGTLAPLASPALTGSPTAPTPAAADNSAAIATTAYVQAQGYPSVPVSVPHGGTGLTGGTSGGVPYYSAAGTMASSSALAARALTLGGGAGAAPFTSGVWSSPAGNTLRGDFTGGSPPATLLTGVQVAGNTGQGAGFEGDAFAGVGYIALSRADGTPAAPTAIAGAERLAQIFGLGYDGAAYQNAAALTFEARQAFSGTQRGAGFNFWGTPNGSTTITQFMSLGLTAGGLSLPSSVAGGDLGQGTVNVSGGYYVGGVLRLNPPNPGTSGGIPYYSATTTLASSALLAANTIMVGGGAGVAPLTRTNWTLPSGGNSLVGNLMSGGAAPGAPSPPAIQLLSADNGFPVLNTATWGTGIGYLTFMQAGGTGAAPSGTVSGQAMGRIVARGYDTAYLTSDSVRIELQAAETFSTTGHGGRLLFSTVAAGTTPLATRLQIENDGGLLAPSTVTGGSRGAGTLNVSGGYYIGGNSIFASPVFTGTPTAPTPATADSSATLATTAYVKAQSYLTGNQPITLSGDVAGSGTTAIATALQPNGVAAGSYQGLTIDATGRVTAAANMNYLTDPNWSFNASHQYIGNFAGGTPPAALSSLVGLQIVGSNAQAPGVQANSFAAVSLINLARADGTPAAPTAIAAAERLAGIYAYGHDGTTYQQVAAVTFEARQTFSASVRGSGVYFFGTPVGSTTITGLMTLGVSGGGAALPNSVAGGDMGIGTVNVSGGYYRGGVAVSDANWTFNASHMLIANSSGAAAPTLMINQPCLQLIGAAGGAPGVQTNAIAATAALQLVRADGTAAAPASLANADRIGQLAANGYTGSAYSGNTGIIDFVTTQAWTATANGTALEFRTTPNGSTANALNMALGASGLGGLSLPGTVTGGDLGVGTVNASAGYYLGGAAALTLSGSTRQLAATTMTGALTLIAPVNPTDAATKQYVDSTSGAVGGPFLPLAGGTMTGALAVNLGGALAPAQVLGALIQGPDNPATVPGLQIVRYGGTAGLQLRTMAAGGTAAAPTVVTQGTILGDWFTLGYSGSAWRTGTILRNSAAENWTATAGGANFQIITTQLGSTTQNSSTFHGNGSLLIPTTVTGGNTGPGTINVSSGYYIGGNSIFASPVFTGTPAINSATPPQLTITAPTGAVAQNFRTQAQAVNTGGLWRQMVYNNAFSVQLNTAAAGDFSTVITPLSMDASSNVWISGKIISTGVSDGSNAAAGQIGEYLETSLNSGQAVGLTTGVVTTLTSLTLTAGDWECRGSVQFNISASATALIGGVSNVTNGYGTLTSGQFALSGTFAPPTYPLLSGGGVRVSVTATTTIYLIAEAVFASGTTVAYGTLAARRMR